MFVQDATIRVYVFVRGSLFSLLNLPKFAKIVLEALNTPSLKGHAKKLEVSGYADNVSPHLLGGCQGC